MDASRILTANEIIIVLADLKRKAKRAPNTMLNLIIFRLSCCCGLRRSEICGIDVGDFILNGDRPILRIRKEITKGRHNVTPTNPEGKDKRRSRRVPLWWDSGTLADIRAWRELRAECGADKDSPFVVSNLTKADSTRMLHTTAANRWRTAIRVLGPERVEQLSIHCGRHSFVSHSLHAGRTMMEVRDAAGHASIAMTSRYAHLIESENVPDTFGFVKS
jgi:integrase